MTERAPDRGPWMQTYTGRAFYLLDPRAEDVALEDIAHALSQICRFTGHCAEPYSVAEHSVRVSLVTEELVGYEATWPGQDAPLGAWRREHARAGLLHDAAEAYVGDVAAPLKAAMRVVAEATGAGRTAFDLIEERVEGAVRKRFGVTNRPFSIDHALLWTNVKAADLILLATEARDLMGERPWIWDSIANVEPLEGRIIPWPATAEREFLARAAALGLR